MKLAQSPRIDNSPQPIDTQSEADAADPLAPRLDTLDNLLTRDSVLSYRYSHQRLLSEVLSHRVDSPHTEDPVRLRDAILDLIDEEARRGELPALVFLLADIPWQRPLSKVEYLTSVLELHPEDQAVLQLAELQQWFFAQEPQPLGTLSDVRYNYHLICSDRLRESGIQSLAHDHFTAHFSNSTPAEVINFLTAYHLSPTVLLEHEAWRQTLSTSMRWTPNDIGALVGLDLSDDQQADLANAVHNLLTEELQFPDSAYFGSSLTNGAAQSLQATAELICELPDLTATREQHLQLQASMAFGAQECLNLLREGELAAVNPLKQLFNDLKFEPTILLHPRFEDDLHETLDALLQQALIPGNKQAFDAQEAACLLRRGLSSQGVSTDLDRHSEPALALVQRNLSGGDPFSAYLVGSAFELGAIDYLHPRTIGSAGWGAFKHLVNWGLPLAGKLFG